MHFLQKNWHIILLCFLCIFALLPLFQSGLFSMHDDEQVARLYDLNQALFAGHIPPRIIPNLGYGYGYPFYNFYPPFAYYVAEVFVLLGTGYIFATKLMIAAGFLLAAFFMYQLSKEFFGKIGGVVAAVAYTYAPYHAVDVYVRGALAEFWSFVFIPAQFWAYYMLFKKQQFRYFLLSIVFNAGLILSHNLVALMSIPFISAFVLFLLIQSKEKIRFSIQIITSVILSVTVTAYFSIPSFFEKKFTLVDILTQELANYSLHFVCPSQFWNSAWGYGASIIGCEIDGLSFQVGKIQLLMALVSIGIFMYFAYKARKNMEIIAVFFLLFIFSLFIQTEYSKFIWDSIQPLWYIQFPWRFLIFTSFTASFLTAVLFILQFNTKTKLFMAIVLIGSIIIFNKGYFQPEKYYVHVSDQDYIDQKIIRWKTSNLAYEYVPKGIATRKTQDNTTAINIQEHEIKKESFSVISGDMKLSNILDFPHKKQVKVDVVTPGTLSLNTYSFPGWKVFLNGQEVSYTDKNKLKLISLDLSKGSHTVTAVFADTMIRFISNLLTLATVICLLVLSFSNRVKQLAFGPQKRVK